jgi:hypothetical protein
VHSPRKTQSPRKKSPDIASLMCAVDLRVPLRH